MRTLASYSLEAMASAAVAAPQLAGYVRAHINAWLQAKGELQVADDRGTLRLRDGRLADVACHELATSKGSLFEISVTEPTSGGSFQTSLAVAHEPGRVSISCELSAGSQSLMPLWVDVHCPRIIREILAVDGASWMYQGSRLSQSPQAFRGSAGGDAFIDLVWDAARAVPVIAISEENGLLLHPGLVEALAADLAGLAVVGHLDSDASWRMTSRRGKHWSCYGGAIRLYWPGVENGTAPLDNPLWTPQRLLHGLVDTESAAGRIRRQIRRHVLRQSAFGVVPSTLFATIRRSAREEELAALHGRIQQGDDHRAIAEEYFTKLVRLNDLLESRNHEIEQIRAQVASLQVALRWRDETEGAVAPVEEAPPATVEDAVLTAMDRYDTLVFGRDVNEGIATLTPEAGPPDKILTYLRALAEMAQARRKGPLGTSPVKWLTDQGVSASGETEQVRTSPDKMRARTWDDGLGRRRQFELHLKPAEGTSPDRCVRIYFDYDEESGRALVAWVGRHP